MDENAPVHTVVLATYGTLGDLHPFLALAIALKQRGVTAIVAAAEVYRQKVSAEGVLFHAMRPDMDAVAARLGMSYTELARAVADRPEFLVREVVLPHVRESCEDVLKIARTADMILTSSAAYGAKLAAERCQVPQIGIVLQPMVFFSAHDPPIIATAPDLSRWVYARGRFWTRIAFAASKSLARRWARPIDRLRQEIGLPQATAHPLFEGQFSAHGAIAMYSPLFGAPQPDHPPDTHIVGFAFYDGPGAGEARLPEALERFLEEDEPPIVFTQGSSAVHDADHFVRESLEAVEVLNARAIFVLDEERAQQWVPRASSSVAIIGYAPYSALFPKARVIVHHGGVGTTAQALRARRPQLIAPYLVDQPDNANRVTRLGCGRTLPLQEYRAAKIVEELRTLMSEPRYGQRAREVGTLIAQEQGGSVAADIIVAKLAVLKR